MKNIGLLMAILMGGCSASTTPVQTQCVVSSDQANTFKGQWTVHPVPLAVLANDFSASEQAAIQAAISTWNSFFLASKGFELYLSGSTELAVVSASTPRLTSATVCNQAVVDANGFTNTIKIYKNTSSWSYGSAVMALTSLCPVTTNSAYPSLVSAIMEINFENYFVSGTPLPDLQSIVTHELGHMLGLDHSCTGAGCTNANQEYVEAVMYPSLGFVGINGMVKQALQANDEQRANCLY